MKKVINGKMYNTDSAKILNYYEFSHCADFNYVREELYKKRTGEYFLYAEGGPRTRYAKDYGDSWGYGEEIIPLTVEKAKRWAEKRLDGDEYTKIFGEPKE